MRPERCLLACFLLAAVTKAHNIEKRSLEANDIYQGCGYYKGCFMVPSGCIGDDCEFIIAWQQTDNYTDFELSVKYDPLVGAGQYVAIGFSYDGNMPGAGTLDCVWVDDTMYIWSGYNDDYVNEMLDDPYLGLEYTNAAGGLIEDRISCQVRRSNADASDEHFMNISASNEWWMLVAYGPALAVDWVDYHLIRLTSGSMIDFSATDIISSVSYNLFVRLHAAFMTLAWGFLAGFGILNARFYKGEFKGKTLCGLAVWFANHRHTFLLVLVLTCLGVSSILYKIGHFEGLGDLSPNILNTHTKMGLAVLAFTIANPIMAIFRGGKDAKQRPYFNWVHRAVGETAMILGYLNIMTGLYLPETGGISDAVDIYLMAVYGFLHLIVEITLLSIAIHEQRAARIGEETPLTEIKEAGDAPEPPKPRVSLKAYILGFYCLVGGLMVIIVTLRMGLGISNGTKPSIYTKTMLSIET